MSGRHKVTARKPQFGRSRSHAFNTTNRKFKLNMQRKRFWVPELQRFVRLDITTQELKTIDKVGVLPWLKRRGIAINSLLD
jgi:large subunit ribosomal protein L28